jgi:hypothetical protein
MAPGKAARGAPASSSNTHRGEARRARRIEVRRRGERGGEAR